MKLGEYCARDPFKLHLFYTDTEHCIEPVSQGYRISLEYEVIKQQDDEVDKYSEYECLRTLFGSSDEPKDDIFEPLALPMDPKALEFIVDYLLSNQRRTPALLMSHLYPESRNYSTTLLRGYDRLLYDALKSQFDIELIPVCLWSQEENGNVTHCVPLASSSYHVHHSRKEQFTLYITPTVVNCMDSLEGAYLDNCDNDDDANDETVGNDQGLLNYTTMAMILNAKTIYVVEESA